MPPSQARGQRCAPASPAHHHHWLLSRVEGKLFADIGSVLATARPRTSPHAKLIRLAGKPLATTP
jgi:hypothetical protein